MKRSREIEDAMSQMDFCVFTQSMATINAWNTVYEYIQQLEFFAQNFETIMERISDDGK